LIGQTLPSLRLASTIGGVVDLASLPGERTVIYCYPRTSEPGKPAPSDWDLIPGARGCTPQACTFRDHYRELQALGADVFGLSTQTTSYQREMSLRLHLPFPVLSDADLKFANTLHLPMFMVDGMPLIKRLTMIVRGRVIEAALYPVRKPEESANDVITWLKEHLR
jgi:peroxiredoxin